MNPKGMSSRRIPLSAGGVLTVLSDGRHIVLQVKRDPSEPDPLAVSVQAGVELSPFEALALAQELLSTLVGRVKQEAVTFSWDRSYSHKA